MSNPEEFHHGRHGDFYWLSSPWGSVGALLAACPAAVRGRPILVTDYHGAPPSPKPEARAKGWRGWEGGAFHPCLPEAESLIWDDVCEIYVLKHNSAPNAPSTHFNDGFFTLRDPAAAIPYEETWDRRGINQRREALQTRQSVFWAVMTDLQAEGYMGVGNNSDFSFVTCRREHVEALIGALRAKTSF